jgi:hypothetical protein
MSTRAIPFPVSAFAPSSEHEEAADEARDADLDRARRKGWAAAFDGIPFDRNPYVYSDDEMALEWADGWHLFHKRSTDVVSATDSNTASVSPEPCSTTQFVPPQNGAIAGEGAKGRREPGGRGTTPDRLSVKGCTSIVRLPNRSAGGAP